VRNRSEQFEARLVMVEITPSPSLFFDGMAGSRMPIVTAHAKAAPSFRENLVLETWVALRYVDNRGPRHRNLPLQSERLAAGITGLTTPDGRFTIVMPHPNGSSATCSCRGRLTRARRIRPGCASSATRGSGCNEA